MKTLSKKEWIAVSVSILFITYAFLGPEIIAFFNGTTDSSLSTASVASSGLQNNIIINDVLVGTGEQIKKGQLIRANYILSLSNGTIIQDSKDLGIPLEFVFGEGEVIPGFDMGFEGMKVGGIRTIVIPPELAYGANEAGPIPPNSTLIFTVEVLSSTEVPTDINNVQNRVQN